jgi:rubredoxin
MGQACAKCYSRPLQPETIQRLNEVSPAAAAAACDQTNFGKSRISACGYVRLQLFKKMDLDGNNEITLEEAVTFWGRNFAKVNANAMFNEVDTDKSKTISKQEFMDFWQQVKNSGYTDEDILAELDSMLDAKEEWVCTDEHVYNTADGAGLPFEQLPENWKCPVRPHASRKLFPLHECDSYARNALTGVRPTEVGFQEKGHREGLLG